MIIDISHHQKDFPFDKAKAEVDFWIVRATHGTDSIDREWVDNVAWLKAHPDEKFAVYGYYYYGDYDNHRLETDNLINRVKDVITFTNFTKIVFLDFEHTKDVGKERPLSTVDREIATTWLLEDYRLLKSLYLIPGVYASREWLKHKLCPNRFAVDMVVWVADYSGIPLKTSYPYRYDLHQYSSIGSLKSTSAFSGALDMDALNPNTKFTVLQNLMTKPLLRYRRGDSSEQVGEIQIILKTKGYSTYTNITNYFGPITEKAVKKFQRVHNLTIDGIVGPITWLALHT